jgi:hypothetical protein
MSPLPLCQNTTSRATDEHATGRLGQVHLGAPRGWAKGVPLHRGIPSSVNSPPWLPEETRLRMPMDDRSQP